MTCVEPQYRTQSIAVTDADARRYIEDLEYQAGALWDAGSDTFDIARALGIHEVRAVFLVSNYRASRRRRPHD